MGLSYFLCREILRGGLSHLIFNFDLLFRRFIFIHGTFTSIQAYSLFDSPSRRREEVGRRTEGVGGGRRVIGGWSTPLVKEEVDIAISIRVSFLAL